MEFASIPRISLYASFLALTACGGGGSSGGSDGGSARSSYTGPNTYASLSAANRDELVFDTYVRLNRGLIAELLDYDELFEIGMEELYYEQQRSVEGSDTCDSGKYDFSSSANESFTSYSLSVDYKNCVLGSAKSNGKFTGKVRLDSPGANLYNANFISVEYDDFKTKEGSVSILFAGKESKAESDSNDTYTLNQTILVEFSSAGEKAQRFSHNISLTRNEGTPFDDPINVINLSGSFYHSDFGRIDLSAEASDQFNGNKVILSGNNSTIVIDYIEATASYEISLDTDGDGIFESQETGYSIGSIID